MKDWAVELLVCPRTGEQLDLRVSKARADEIITGELVTPSGQSYPILNGVPRFVRNHYATAFGLQWNRHADTQIDDDHHMHSAQRFWRETGFTPDGISGKLILDGGCGAGRFVDVASRAGARVIAVDLSEAVDACHGSFGERENVCVIQASLFDLPFRDQTFDAAFTIGVIQHTPRPLKALSSLAETVKVGGEMAVSWYKKYWYTYLHQKYWLRPLFRSWSDERLYRFISWYVPKLLPLSRLLCCIAPASVVDRIVPVANRDYVSGLSKRDKLEWAILDTYDWYNPAYDKPQTWRAVERTMRAHGYRCERAPARREGLHCVRASVP